MLYVALFPVMHTLVTSCKLLAGHAIKEGGLSFPAPQPAHVAGVCAVPAPDGEPLSEPATPVSGRSGPSDGPAPLMDPRHPNMPVLDENMLFFTRGLLTFGAGMNLKMACTR